jgi:hypothetical protein
VGLEKRISLLDENLLIDIIVNLDQQSKPENCEKILKACLTIWEK